MSEMAGTPIMDALKDAASADPEKAQEVVGQLKEKWDSLSPEQQQEALGKLSELKDKVAGLSEEQKTQIADLIREKAGV